MRITKKQIIDLKRKEKRGSLIWDVLNIIQKEDNIKEYLENVLEHRCSSGFVTELIYYNQTEKWFKKHCIEIVEMVGELKSEYGNIDFIKEFDYNHLAWLSFENTVYNIASTLGMDI